MCPLAPCEISMERYGMHERIVDHYLSLENRLEAYYYIQDLLSNAFINCDLEEMERLKRSGEIEMATSEKEKLKKYPPGCRVFVISNKMKDVRREIRKHEKKRDSEGDDPMSDESITEYEKNKILYEDYCYDILDLLKHLVVDERYKSTNREKEHQKHLDLYACALKAKQAGLNVEDGVGGALEHGFVKAAELSGMTPKSLEARKNHENLLKKGDERKKQEKMDHLLSELENEVKTAKNPEKIKLIKQQIKELRGE